MGTESSLAIDQKDAASLVMSPEGWNECTRNTGSKPAFLRSVIILLTFSRSFGIYPARSASPTLGGLDALCSLKFGSVNTASRTSIEEIPISESNCWLCESRTLTVVRDPLKSCTSFQIFFSCTSMPIAQKRIDFRNSLPTHTRKCHSNSCFWKDCPASLS